MKILFFLFFSLSVMGMDIDQKLSIVKDVYNLKAKECFDDDYDKIKFDLGKFFFEESYLSQQEDTSCKSCHLDDKGSADGLSIAVGSGGIGEGFERLRNGKGALVARNALSLVGTSNKEFKSYFWDGKVERNGKPIVSQFGEKISNKFQNILAVASIHPILERDEIMGSNSDMARAIGNSKYHEKYTIVENVLKKRIFQSQTKVSVQLVKKLKDLGITYENFELAHIGNFIAIFINKKFQCSESRFDKYLNGNLNALSKEEKEGALIFYGKGRCASCHSGSLLSDFKYHSIGSPQGHFGPYPRKRDIGRAGITNKAEDLYLFRTPPLIEVSQTAPYGHSGVFQDLKSVITHHYNPVAFYKNNPEYYEADKQNIGKYLGSRDKLLNAVEVQDDNELVSLIQFLLAI